MDFSRTFFVTTTTYKRYEWFRDRIRARKFFRVLYDYREQGKFLMHAFVLMPDHLHLILTPAEDLSLEKAMQFIKGGSAFHLKLPDKLWQPSFTNHRIRDGRDYEQHVEYVRRNPVKKRLVARAEEYPLCSFYPGWKLDEVPRGLKPQNLIVPVTRG